MSKQMNQYALVFNRESSVTDVQSQEYQASFQAAAMAALVGIWMIANKIDHVGSLAAISPQPAEDKPLVTVNTTEEGVKKLAEAFNGKLAEVKLVQENVFTDPGPYVKKTRRPGFENK